MTKPQPPGREMWTRLAGADLLDDLRIDRAGLRWLLDRFRDQLDAGDLHYGAQVAMYRRGRLVLEAGGGFARLPPSVPNGDRVEPDTVFILLSATKAWAAVAAHMLVERGVLSYEARVAEYWPEFARHGKDAVTVLQALSHRGGYPTPAPEVDADRAVEESELQFEPGSANAYHFSNFGDTVAGLVRRIDGRATGRFVLEEILQPLRMDDSFLGERPDRAFPDDRVAWIYEMEEGTPGSDFPSPGPIEPELAEYEFIFNRPDVQRSGRASGGGLAPARDLARFYGCLANGGEIDGIRLLEPETITRATARTNAAGEVDRYMRLALPWSMGFHLGGEGGEGLGMRTGDEASFGHGGGACTVGFADPGLALGFAYLTNGNLRWGPKPFTRTGELADLAREACRT